MYSAQSLLPEKYNGSAIDNYQHELLLFALVVTLEAKQILELGCREGYTTEALLKAAEITNGIVHTVDKQNRNNLPFVKNKRWIFNQCDTIEFIKNNRLVYDLIYIDDWHHGKHVLEELTKLQYYIKPSGLIIMHDTMWNNPPHYYRSEETSDGEMGGGGPAVALFNFVHRSRFLWEYVTIPTNHGLTILRKVSEEQI